MVPSASRASTWPLAYLRGRHTTGAHHGRRAMQILGLEGDPRATVWNGFLRSDYMTWEVGQDCPVHYHEGAVELFVFIDGECEMTVGEEVQNVKAGHAVYVGPNVPHKLKAIGD